MSDEKKEQEKPLEVTITLNERQMNAVFMALDAAGQSAGFFKVLSQRIYVLPGTLGQANTMATDQFLGELRAIGSLLSHAVDAAKKKSAEGSIILFDKPGIIH